MGIADDIKRDREAGTPGPWRVRDCESYGDRCKTFYQEVWNDQTDILVTTEVTRAHTDGGAANMRRIARVPQLEAIALAAEELAASVEARIGFVPAYEAREGLRAAITAYRKATEAAK